MKFCCEQFEGYYKISDDNISQRYPAIKILEVINEPWNTNKILNSFIILCGYVSQKPQPPFITISHCPFCGIKLRDFYKNKEYANEKWSNIFKN